MRSKQADSPSPSRDSRIVILTAVFLAAASLLALCAAPVAAQAPGTVWAWGWNALGQLGDGSTFSKSAPVQVKGAGGTGLLGNVTAVATGGGYSIALKDDGTVWSWGDNGYGQLGDNTTANRLTPVQTKGLGGTGYLTGIVAIATGSSHAVALKSDGTVWAWGSNYYGQLGDNTTTSHLAPVQVVGPLGNGFLTGIVAIVAGYRHTVALKSDGTVWTWGHNFYGQLGVDPWAWVAGVYVHIDICPAPVQVRGFGGAGHLSAVMGVAAGYGHTLILQSDGTVAAFGDNRRGQLGDGTTANKSYPVRVLGPGGTGNLSNVSALGCGQYHCAALKNDGTVWAWGDNSNGELGNNSSTSSSVPVQTRGSSGAGYLGSVSAIAVEHGCTAALKTDGTVWAWGYNADGQLGDNTTMTRRLPVQTKGSGGAGFLAGIRRLGVGSSTNHFMAIVGPLTTYTLTASSAAPEKGTVTRFPSRSSCFYGDGVRLEATVARGWQFTGWSCNGGAMLDATAAKTAVFVTGNCTATANFTALPPNTFAAVVGTSGAGTVSFTPDQGPYYAGDTIQVQATALPGYDFAGWTCSGGTLASSTAAQTNLTITGNCTLTANFVEVTGQVWGWGLNSAGQLGEGVISTDRASPVQAVGIGGAGTLHDIAALAVGSQHTVALQTDGTVLCWGMNNHRQLGNNSWYDSAVPVYVKGPGGSGLLSGVAAVAAGEDHSVALKSDGTVWTWGDSWSYQASAGGGWWWSTWNTPVQSLAPGGTDYLTNAVAVAAGEHFTASLLSSGTVFVTGSNYYGQCGTGIDYIAIPGSLVKGSDGTGVLSEVVALAAGRDHVVALKSDGTVWAWGCNSYGQLGDGSTSDRYTPVQVRGPGGAGVLSGIVDLAAGESSVVALKGDGTVWAWGRNDLGQLGDGTTAPNRMTPVQVAGSGGVGWLSDITAVTAGLYHGAALKSDGTVWAWGSNGFGALGDGTGLDHRTPVPVTLADQTGLLTGVRRLAKGSQAWHMQAIVGPLPARSLTFAASDPAAGTIVRSPDQGSYQYGDAVRLRAMAAPGWGFVGWSCSNSAVMDARVVETVLLVTGDATITANFVSAAQTTAVWTWGRNNFGQLGDGTTTGRPSLGLVAGSGGTGFLPGAVAVSVGLDHTVALKSDGTVWSWGNNRYGKLGDNTAVDRPTPVQVTGPGGMGFLTDIVAVAAGPNHTLALKSDGTVWAWGDNSRFQLGSWETWEWHAELGTYLPVTEQHAPVQVPVSGYGFYIDPLAEVVAVAAGFDYSLALKADGTLWAWGANFFGTLGDDMNNHDQLSPYPTPVRGPDGTGTLTNVVDVAAGDSHALAVKADGTVWSWGWNGYGQLGIGAVDDEPHGLPVQVAGLGGVGYLGDVVAVAAGVGHTVVLRSDSSICAWGGNFFGQLGDGSAAQRTVPGLVLAPGGGSTLLGAVDVTAGGFFGGAGALMPDGAVLAWGSNDCGQLGDNTFTDRTLPVPVTGPGGAGYLSGAARLAMAAGADHSAAIIGTLSTVALAAEVSPSGAGTVAGNPSMGQVPYGTLVRLQATAAPGKVFSHWTAEGGTVLNAASAEASLLMGGDCAVTAWFDSLSYQLTVNSGYGEGTFESGSVVTIWADVPAGHYFVAWTGDVADVADVHATETTIVMNGNCAVTANYALIPPPVISAGLDRDWIYQNAPATTGGRHGCTLTLAISGPEPDYPVTVRLTDGPGLVTLSPGADMFTWTITAQDRMADGITGSGPATITITTGYESPEGYVEVNRPVILTVRQLGDIDGQGGCSGQDRLLMNKRLNGLVPDGPQFDLDGQGGCSGQDKLILNKILNGLAIP